jgi:membrane-associated phospholipid phosphatase
VWLTIMSAVALAALTLLVLGHAPDSLDLRIRNALDPRDEWGTKENLAFDLADGLRPMVLMATFAVLAALTSVSRRSLSPVVYAGALALAATVCEVGFKWVMPRIESSGGSTGTSSFPSGHVLCSVIVPGGLLLMTMVRTRWWQWVLAAVLPACMVVLTMVAQLHWASDVLGGLLLGVFLLSASGLSPLRPSSAKQSRTGSRQDEVQPAPG